MNYEVLKVRSYFESGLRSFFFTISAIILFTLTPFSISLSQAAPRESRPSLSIKKTFLDRVHKVEAETLEKLRRSFGRGTTGTLENYLENTLLLVFSDHSEKMRRLILDFLRDPKNHDPSIPFDSLKIRKSLTEIKPHYELDLSGRFALKDKQISKVKTRFDGILSNYRNSIASEAILAIRALAREHLTCQRHSQIDQFLLEEDRIPSEVSFLSTIPSIRSLDSTPPHLVQIDQSSGPDSCTICYENFDSENRPLKLERCRHLPRYCADCFRQYIKVFCSETTPVPRLKCPEKDCIFSPTLRDLKNLVPHLSIEEINQARNRVFRYYQGVSFVFCNGCNKILKYNGQVGSLQCPTCKELSPCLNCQFYHGKEVSCALVSNPSLVLKSFQDQNVIQICPRCKQGVVRTEGCSHIKCRCGHDFTYHGDYHDAPHTWELARNAAASAVSDTAAEKNQEKFLPASRTVKLFNGTIIVLPQKRDSSNDASEASSNRSENSSSDLPQTFDASSDYSSVDPETYTQEDSDTASEDPETYTLTLDHSDSSSVDPETFDSDSSDHTDSGSDSPDTSYSAGSDSASRSDSSGSDSSVSSRGNSYSSDSYGWDSDSSDSDSYRTPWRPWWRK